MNIVLLGIQGSGKGTLVLDLEKSFDFSLISMGSLLREEIASNSPLGLQIKEKTDKGELVDLDIVMATLKKKLDSAPAGNIIFDGFPRNIEQAVELDKICTVDKVIYLNLTKDKAIERILNRLTCKKCGYITSKTVATSNVCPICNGELAVRSDDNIEAIHNRFDKYENETFPLVELYKSRGVLFEIDASKNINEVYNDVMKVIK